MEQEDDRPLSFIERSRVWFLTNAIRSSLHALLHFPIYRDFTENRISVTLPLPAANDLIRLLVFFPSAPPARDGPKRAPVIHLHGGGWTLSCPESEGRTQRIICDRLGTVVIAPDYKKAPQYPYPAALDQLHALLGELEGLSALKGWSEEQRAWLAATDFSKVALTGGSSGGNLAAALVVKSSLSPTPANAHIVAVGLIYPSLDITIPVADKIARLSEESKTHAYLPPPRKEKVKSPLVSPALAPKEILDVWPSTAIIAAEDDALCQEAVEFAELLQAHGRKVESRKEEGVPHAFDLQPRSPASEQVERNEAARERAWECVAQVLEGEL